MEHDLEEEKDDTSFWSMETSSDEEGVARGRPSQGPLKYGHSEGI